MFLPQFWLQCFLIVGICFYLLACGQDDRLLIKIGVNVPKTTAPTYTLMRQAMIDQANTYNAEEHLDRIEIVWNGVQDGEVGKNPAAMERQQVTTMINQGVQVLILSTVDFRSAYAILREAKSPDRPRPIPVITLDTMLGSSQIRGHLAINEIRLGEIAAKYAVEQVEGHGNILVLEGPLGSPSFRQLTIGIYRILDRYQTIRVLSKSSLANTNEGRRLTSQIIRAYAQNVQAVICVNSDLAVGAVESVDLYGMTEQIVTVGIGASRVATALIISGQHDAEVDLQPYERGKMALKLALDAYYDKLTTTDQNQTQFGPSRVITVANYTDLEKMWPNLIREQQNR